MSVQSSTDQPSDYRANEVTWAVALVHGIGTTEPMRMITEVSDAIREASPALGLELDAAAEVHVDREPRDLAELQAASAVRPASRAADPERSCDASQGAASDASVHYNVIRHGRMLGGTLRIGTAHWADITYYRRGLLSLIGALMMTAFGVRFFAEVAASTDDKAHWVVRALAWLQRWVLKVMVWIIAVVAFPVTFVTLVFSLMSLVGIYVLKTAEVLQRTQKEMIALSGLGICLAIAWIGFRRSREFRKERPMGVWMFGSLGLFGAALGVAMFLGDFVWVAAGDGQALRFTWRAPGEALPPAPFLPFPILIRDFLVGIARWFEYTALADRIRIVDSTGALLAMMHCLQLVAGIVLLFLTLVAAVNLAILVPAAKLSGNGARTFVFATVSVITIWIVNLVLLWPENLATFAALTQFLDDELLKETIRVNALDWERWRVEELAFGLGQPKAERLGFMKGRLYADTYPVMWFEAMFIVFLVLSTLLALGVFAARKMWSVWLRMRHVDLATFAPRRGETRPLRACWPRLIIARGYVVLVLILIVIVPGTLLALVLNATKLSDIFPILTWIGKRVPQDISIGAEWGRLGVIIFLSIFLLFSHWISDGSKLVLDVVNHFAAPKLRFPVRQRINLRFERMIDRLLDQEDKPNLVIIAHSQGTVITLDALKRQEWIDRVLPRVETLTILTFGSPITHVYQRYFPQLYKPLEHTSLASLSRDGRVRWINVYRVDDYVGTWVDNSIEGFPVNVPVGPGGHTRYWSKDVFVELFQNAEMRRLLAAMPPPR